MQLVEIDTDGSRTPLTDLPGRCTGRYLPGSRAVVVEHDAGGDENWQLSALDLDPARNAPAGLEDLTPLVRDARYMHVLQDVTATRLVYSTNRRNGVDMDVIVRAHDDGSEQVAYDEGGYVAAVRASHDGTSAAVVRLSLQPASTVVQTVGPRAFGSAGGRAGYLTHPDEHASHTHVHWAGDDDGLILSSNHDREFHALWRLDAAGWHQLVADEQADLACWLSPDATMMVVARHLDGVLEFALYDADGTHRTDLDIPALGSATVTWSTDSGYVVIGGSAPPEPGVIFRVLAATGRVHQVCTSAGALEPALRERLVAPSVHRVPTEDGEEVPCFVYPGASGTDVDGASVLHIHGGPEAAAYQTFAPVIQALAATGLTVLVPNVRGSAG